MRRLGWLGAAVMLTMWLMATVEGPAVTAQVPAPTDPSSRDLPARWDELTASDWPAALERSKGVAILPIGVLEKHGPQAPIGADLIRAREYAARAAEEEYAVVFPDYFYGQIYEARHQPGTFALPSELIWELLQATCDEIARNGFDKILIVNGHGGNPNFLRFFVQAQLEKRRDYAVYLHEPAHDPAFAERLSAARKSDPEEDLHGGERETSELLYLRPELVQIERSGDESGDDLRRLDLAELYTGIWWFASYPNHYAGDASVSSREVGELIVEHRVDSIVRALRTIKDDARTLELQEEFFDRVLN
ncbi:MAG TPA: creatininase family protein [Thermoanaerobaculia bacterium]|nr:creatininase family protein [Thermoanaerobaculia bacterium]